MAVELVAEAIHENFLAACTRVGALSERSAVARRGPWLLVDTGDPTFRVADAASALEHASEADLDVAIDWFEARDAGPRFRLREPHDDALIARLKERGFDSEYIEPALYRADVSPPPYGGPLAISSVESNAELEAFGAVNWPAQQRNIGVAIARTAREHGFDLLLGRLDRTPIATSMAVTTGSLVGLYNVAVEERFRRRGFGVAISWAAIRAGVRRGALHAWMGATEMGLPVYEKMGFRRRLAYHHLARTQERD